MTEKSTINTIHERDLDKLLNKIELKEDFINKKVKCRFCEKIVDINNLYAISNDNGSYIFICDSIECINKFFEYSDNKNKK